MRHRAVVVVVAVMAAVISGCGGEDRVGDEGLLEFDEQGSDRPGRLQSSTTAAAAEAATTVVTAPGTTAPPTASTARPSPPPTATATTVAGFTVRIIDGGQGFDPFNFVVRRGTRVVVTNADDEPRTFTSDTPGAFDSGPIRPGGTFEYLASTAGKFNFHDQTRPFAVGQMEVAP